MRIDDPILLKLSRFLDYAARKQKLIASNIANAETPGYQAKELTFQDFLAAEKLRGGAPLRRTNERHLPGKPSLVRPVEHRTAGGSELGYDGNNVDLEKELVELAENVMKFTVMSRLLRGKLDLVRSGIKEGRG